MHHAADLSDAAGACQPHCGGRGGGAARLRGKGAGGKRRGRGSKAYHRGAPLRRRGLSSGHRRRKGHPAGGCAHGVSAPRHLQGAPGERSGRHLHAGLPGRSAGGHRVCRPGGSVYKDPVLSGGHPDLPGGRKGNGLWRDRLPPGHHGGGAGSVLQCARPGEVFEKGRHRGGLCGGAGDPDRHFPAGDRLPLHQGRPGELFHQRRRQDDLRHLCLRRTGSGRQAAGAGRLLRGAAGDGLYLSAGAEPGRPEPAELLHQRALCPLPAADGGSGGGL